MRERKGRAQGPAGLLLLALACLGGHWGTAVAVPEPAPPPPATLVVEDSVPVPSRVLSETEIRARRATIEEILSWTAAGEAHRDSAMHDQVYDLFVRVLSHKRDSAEGRKLLLEEVSRVYRQAPDLRRKVLLRRSAGGKVQVRIGPGMGEEIVGFAFDPEVRGRYRFTLLGRDFVGRHVIYRIGFEPRSQLYPLPSGQLWVDTNEFVIVRQEFWYRDRSPAPLVIKALDNCIVERTLVGGRYWVVSRVAARVTFTLPVLGIPPQADMLLSLQNYRINQGIDPEVFRNGGESGPMREEEE